MAEALTVGQLVERALLAYEELGTLAETIEEEWSYTTELGAAWRERLEVVAAERGSELSDQSEQAAVDRAIDEVSRIRDPHRAIDWLSTFPQVVLSAVGERP
jgi:hypothetical protein